MSRAFKLVFSLALVFFVMWLSTAGMDLQNPNWYLELNKPNFYPPSYLFGIVWPILYLMIAFSLWFLLINTNRFWPLFLFYFQLFLNASWSYIFVYFELYFVGFLVLTLLSLVLFVMILSYWKISKASSLLLVPYFLWILFATFLNYSLWQLNS